jgi:hypothetical protein
MPKQFREMPAYHDLDPLPGQRLPWELPWEPRDQEESRLETDPGEMPGDEDPEETEEGEADEGGGSGAAIYPLSEHLALG